MKQKPKRRKSILLRLIVLGVSVFMIADLVGRGNELAKYKAELAEVEKQRDIKLGEIEELEELLDKDAYSAVIEKAARERLGYVYSDEIIYIDISGN